MNKFDDDDDDDDCTGRCNIHTVIFWVWVVVSVLSLISGIVFGD